MLAALVPWVAVRLVVELLLRPHFMTPLGLTRMIPQKCSGNVCGGNDIVNVPPTTGHIGDLLVTNPGSSRILYQPASRVWEFQSIATAIYVALTLAVLGTCGLGPAPPRGMTATA